jgi:replicative DNA helicase
MFKELLEEDIEKGIRGENKGIPTGFKSLDSATNGIQKSMMVIVGGNSG